MSIYLRTVSADNARSGPSQTLFQVLMNGTLRTLYDTYASIFSFMSVSNDITTDNVSVR